MIPAEKRDGDFPYWYLCPRCRHKLFKFRMGASVEGIAVFCRRCREESPVRIRKGGDGDESKAGGSASEISAPGV